MTLTPPRRQLRPGELGVPHYRRPAGVGRETAVHYGVLLLTAVLVLAPVLPVLYQSFADRPLYEAGGLLTADNYVRLFTEAGFGRVVLNSLVFAVLTTAIALVGGAALAILLVRTRIPGGGVLTAVLRWPIYISPLVLAFGWIILYGPAGFITLVVADAVGFTPWNLYTIPGMALTEAVAAIPLAYLYCASALRYSDTSLESAARTCGSGPLRILGSVILPTLRPPLVYSGLLIFTSSLESLSVPLLYGQPAGIDMFSSFLYTNGIASIDPDYGILGAASVIILGVTAALVWVQTRLLRDSQRFVSVRGKAVRQRPLDLGAVRWAALAVIVVYVLIGPFLPVMGLLLRAFTTLLTPLVSPLEFLSLDNFAVIFTYPVYSTSIVNSLIVSLAGAVLLTVFATLVVLVSRRSGFRFARTLELLALAPQAIPGVVLGVGFFWAFTLLPEGTAAVRASLVAIVIVFSVRSLPVAFGAVAPIVMQIGTELDSAARVAGADWWRTVVHVFARLLTPAYLSSFVLVFVQMIKEFAPAVFIATAATQVIGTTTFELWMQGTTGPVAAMATIQIAITAVCVAIAGRIEKGRTNA
ncbi:ABC transporter permease [Nocardiopsis mangrovi]|uniref:ABC transporter permease n=1 Tax=Nocardiopsis mangrovi TaxID=1179818 RepID=A0ABV9E379_9ACTN